MVYSLEITLIYLATNTSTDRIHSIQVLLEFQKSIILKALLSDFDATISASLMNLQGIVSRL